MIHHVKGLQDTSQANTIILHPGTKDLKSKSSPEQTADNIINLATFVKSDKNCALVSGWTTRTNKLNERETNVIEVLQCKCGTTNLPFIDNSNIYSNMLNFSGFYLNDRGTTRSVKNFCYTLAWCKQICTGKSAWANLQEKQNRYIFIQGSFKFLSDDSIVKLMVSITSGVFCDTYYRNILNYDNDKICRKLATVQKLIFYDCNAGTGFYLDH